MTMSPGLARALPIVVVAAVTLGSFAPTTGGALLAHHDVEVVRQAGTRGLGPGALMALVASPVSHDAPPPAYQPLAAVSVALDARVWGEEAYGHHLTSVVLHTLNALLAYLLIATLVGLANPGAPHGLVGAAAAVAALAWALHPLRVEPVAWVSARSAVLSTTCALGAILCHLRAVTAPPDAPPTTEWRAASVVLAGLAMLANAAAIALPVVLLVLDAYPLRRPAVLAEKLPYVLVALAVALVTLRAGVPDPSTAVANTAFGLWFYAWKTVAPIGLSPIYQPPAPHFVACGLAVLAVTVALIVVRRRWPAALAAWTAYVVLVLPYALLDARGPSIAADRHAYAATLPFAVLLGGGLLGLAVRPTTRRTRIALATAAVAGVALLAVWSASEAAAWHDTRALWTTAAERQPESLVVRLAAARALRDGGEPALAVPHYEAVLAHDLPPAERAAVDADLSDALTRLGHAALYEDDPARALAHFERARDLAPANHRTRLDLAGVYLQLGRVDEATAELERALAVDPSDESTLNAMALALMRAERLDDAELRLRQALAVSPDNAVTRTNLGAVLQKLGRLDEAIQEWEEALRIDPDLVAARQNLDHWHDADDTAP